MLLLRSITMSEFDKLPYEIIQEILDRVVLCGKSKVGNVAPCFICNESKRKCMHLTPEEGKALTKLKLVCCLWNNIIEMKGFTNLWTTFELDEF